MLSLADTNLPSLAQRLLEKDIHFTFLVPTETAIKKSIIDAHELFRSFLVKRGIHEYSTQQQGPLHKVLLPAYFLAGDEPIPTKISMYRPETKEGDPRVWVYGLQKYARPNNVVAIIHHQDKLFVLNCSEVENFDRQLNSCWLAHEEEKSSVSPVVSELLEKLKVIAANGFVKTITAGDTGIGMTLESLLGIQANSSRDPDYKGIELKSKRSRSRAKNAKEQLFSKVPLWKSSPVKKAGDLVALRGYRDDDGYLALRHTISGDKPNSLGLYLEVDIEQNLLKQMFYNKDTGTTTHDVSWNLEELKKSLFAKHKETFWVYAETQGSGADEEFHFTEVTHTRMPDMDKFDDLLSTGLITVDYTMHIKENNRVRDHGYLFKIRPSAFSILFPEPITYRLQ